MGAYKASVYTLPNLQSTYSLCWRHISAMVSQIPAKGQSFFSAAWSSLQQIIVDIVTVIHRWAKKGPATRIAWWRHQKEIFPVLLGLCVGISPITGEFSAQRPVTRGFDVFLDLLLNKQLSKQSWGWWFETQSRSLWCHYNGVSLSWHRRALS